MDKTLHPDILILGAGIAGAALACSLRDRGQSIVMVEAAAQQFDTARGDHLQPHTVEILDNWGALPALFKAGAEKRLGSKYLTTAGDLILDVPLDDLPVPHPYYLYLAHELFGQALLDVAAENPNFQLIKPATAKNFDIGPNGIERLTLDQPDGSIVIEPKMTVVADGRGSRARTALGLDVQKFVYDDPLVVMFAPRTEDDPRNEVNTYLGPGVSVSRIPRINNHWKVGFNIKKDDVPFWRKSSMEQRAEILASKSPCMAGLETELAGFYPVQMIHCEKWTVGTTVLLGDAAHALHPARGQGMSVAIRSVRDLLTFLPDPGDFAAEKIATSVAAYEAAVRPGMEAVLAENHQRALQSHDQQSDPSNGLAKKLAGIQADADRHYAYRMQSAGYGLADA